MTAAPAEISGFSPGTMVLDKYRIVRELGRGGMGLVVCAEHLTLKTLVAMKILLPEFAKLPDAPQRFLREAQAATKIAGDHVAKVLDVGTLPDGTPYMVMEYLTGKDLGRHVKEGTRFGVEEAIDYVVQAAEALAHAHAAAIVHRDVKPSNLFLTRRSDGEPVVKMLDFGISKVVEEAAADNLQLTKTTAVMGSALYMSLEQMRSTKTVDYRTDIYALGITLYELLTGTHPFTADTFSELCVKVSLDPPVPLRDHRPDVPAELADAIAIAYARKPEERYQTVGGFAAALESFAAPRTRPMIDAIRHIEEESHPGGVPVRRVTPTDGQRPPQPGWAVFAVLGGIGLAAAAGLWITLTPRGESTTSGTTTADAAPTVPDEGSAHPDPLPSASVIVPPSASVIVPPSASISADPVPSALPDAGTGKPNGPCRPGQQFYILPSGMRKLCPL